MRVLPHEQLAVRLLAVAREAYPEFLTEERQKRALDDDAPSDGTAAKKTCPPRPPDDGEAPAPASAPRTATEEIFGEADSDVDEAPDRPGEAPAGSGEAPPNEAQERPVGGETPPERPAGFSDARADEVSLHACLDDATVACPESPKRRSPRSAPHWPMPAYERTRPRRFSGPVRAARRTAHWQRRPGRSPGSPRGSRS